MTPPTLLTTNEPIWLIVKFGFTGGSFTRFSPMSRFRALTLVNRLLPVSTPLVPPRAALLTVLAALVQAVRWSSVRPRQAWATRVRLARTPSCEADLGLVGMTRARLIDRK